RVITFFFQAEDGIRDRNVTGVQTCALPISHYVNRELVRNMSRAFEDFVDAAYDEKRIPLEWVEASASDTSNLRLTKEQLAEITAEYEKTTMAFIDKYRGRSDPGSRPVQIQFNAFPLIDGEETPS